MQNKSPKYSTILNHDAEGIISDLDEIRHLFEHNPSLGSAVEQKIQQLIRKYLPSTCEVTSGFAINSDGHLSPQQDILIIKKHQIGPLKSYAGFGVYPIEHVLASIEVKTKLTIGELQAALNSLEKLAVLSPKIPGKSTISNKPGNLLKTTIPVCSPFTGIFALETDIAVGRLLYECQNHNSNKSISERLNSVIVLGHSFSCWVNRTGVKHPSLIIDPQAVNHAGADFDWENRPIELATSESNPTESLKAFLGMLLSFLSWYMPPPISLQKYLLEGLKLGFDVQPKAPK
ncbi:MAG TPA: hypothetical protein PKC06_16400 [Saprospiraceae bacterium]|jgi:hypothetical protein|nr:hypothetical protein [Saprospiraceae bacterium]